MFSVIYIYSHRDFLLGCATKYAKRQVLIMISPACCMCLVLALISALGIKAVIVCAKQSVCACVFLCLCACVSQ